MTISLTRAEQQHYMTLRQALIDAHLAAREISNRPSDACALLIDKIGMDYAKDAVALLIVCKGEWDRRISDRNRAWAESIIPYGEDLYRSIPGLFYPPEIHPAHLDMIADYMRKI
jgi:hypothetical protein